MKKLLCPKCKEQIFSTLEEKESIIDGRMIIKVRPLYYPIYKDGKMQWRNLFRVDFISVMFVISFLLISFGVQGMLNDCDKVTSHVCSYAYKRGCMNCFEPKNESDVFWNLNSSEVGFS